MDMEARGCIIRLVFMLALMLSTSGDAWSQAPPEEDTSSPPRTEAEVGASYESLTKGFASWRSLYAQGLRSSGDGKVIYGRFTEARRFSLDDQSFMLGTYYPLTRRLAAQLEAEASPSHNYLAKWSVLGRLHQRFDKGWGVQLGFRHSEYNIGSPNYGLLTIERYWDVYRAGYTLQLGQLEGADLAPMHLVQADHYYGNSNVGVGFAVGRELENLVPSGILETDVLYVFATGRHWFSHSWAVRYALILHEKGDIYTSRGINLGLVYRL